MSGVNASKFRLLSQVNAVGSVVATPVISPGQGFVLFEGDLATVGVPELFATPIEGLADAPIVKLSPTLLPGLPPIRPYLPNRALFRPSSNGTGLVDNDLVLLSLPTLPNSLSSSSPGIELYVSSITRGAPVRISPLLQDASRQSVTLVGYCSSYIVFCAVSNTISEL